MAIRKNKKSNYRFLTRRFPKRMQKKLVMLFMAVILAFLFLIGKITYINASKGSKYTKIVLDQQTYDSRVIPYKRGDIVDRNGTKIATSERVYNVILDVYVMTSKQDYISPTKKVLKDCFDIEEDKVDQIIEENPDSRYQILAENVTYEKAQEFKKIEEDTENYPNVKGVWLEDDYKRNYPYSTLASDVIGFASEDNNGALGIESAYNDVLNGMDGREYGYFSDDASLERTVKDAKNGNTVVSTIDVTLQSIVEQCIKEFNDEHAGEEREDELGSKNTAVMIMNPNTGEILAEASYPNFDLNNPRDLTAVYSTEKWNAKSEDEKFDAMNEIWRNFCVSDAYEPGSTIKPFTVATGLDTGALKGDETYNCQGYLHVGDWDIRCHLTSGHGTESIADAVANSCNVALMEMAEAIGKDDFIRYQHIFGFGEYTGIDLPGEASTSGLLFTKDTMGETDLATSSFGQSFNVTMTQMISAFSSLVNGGNYYEPHIVKQIQDENGKVIETKNPVLLRKTISQETSEQVKTYLKAVMEYGTGKSAAVDGYDIGAKTGTAEKLPRNNGKYLLSYIGCAPLDNPEVVIYVVIDEPNVASEDDSTLVLNLAKKIMSQAFPYLKISTVEGYDPAAAQTTDDATDSTDSDTTTSDDSNYEYTDYDESYADTYSNWDGAYIDETYTPDFTDWTSGGYTEQN